MTAFITHYWKKTRLDLIRLLFCACVFSGLCSGAYAEAPITDVNYLRVEKAGDALLLSATVKFDLTAAVEDALLKGVAMIFVAEADIFRERWYWTNKKVESVERHMRLAYQPLTRRWRLSVASGLITNSRLGVALNQNFDSLPAALSAIQRLSRWRIGDVSDIDLQQNYILEFRFRLDVSQLPRPLQIGTLGQSDWDIATVIRRPLVIESTK